MAITSNVGGALKQLNPIYANVNGTVKTLNTVHTNVGGTLKQIHSGEKCLNINIASLSSTVPIGTYSGCSYPDYSLHTPYKIYLPDFQTPLRIETDFSCMDSSLVNMCSEKNNITATGITFIGFHTQSGGQYGGGGRNLSLEARKDGNYLCIYLYDSTFSWNRSGNTTVVSCSTKDITTPLKAKLYYK